eukprot:825359-Amphidinium_carterae.1
MLKELKINSLDMNFISFLKKLGVRDCPTHANVELLSKQVLVAMRNRKRNLNVQSGIANYA